MKTLRPHKNSRTVQHDPTMIADVSDTFKLLGDPTRLRILLALAEREWCTLDLATFLSMTESAISHQLRLMKAYRLVKPRKEGKLVFYSLDDEHVEDLIRVAIRHHGETKA